VFTGNLFAVLENEPHEMTGENPRAPRFHNPDFKLR